MGTVMTGFTMSLDGFIADRNDGVEPLFRWYESGPIEYTFPSGEMTAHVSAESLAVLKELNESTGAIVTGRRLFDITNGWDGRHPEDVPIVVLTHEVPEAWVEKHPDAPFTFVTEGLARAVEEGRRLAGEKKLALAGADVAQQAIRAGLVDEIGVELAPVLLGEGIRFFDHLGPGVIELECTQVVDAPGIVHLRYRVLKG